MTRRILPRLLSGAALLLLSASALHAQNWTLQWSDEFDGPANTSPNPANWTYDTGAGGWGNGELEHYCAALSRTPPCNPDQPNTFLDGQGHLVIRAINSNGIWTSGRMLTKGRHAFVFNEGGTARIEARMKLTPGAGLWPAFWMLGDNIDTVNWPKSGEQDIMEWVQKYTSTTTSSTVHGPGYSGAKSIGHTFTFPAGSGGQPQRIDDGFHTYGVLWSKDKLQFYRDDPSAPFFTMTPADIPAGTTWVYNQPFFILLNFAIGSGGFAGTTNASTPSSATAIVDYVRVYQSNLAAANRVQAH